tara:strand:- start:3375 stop:4250 length:876 start_codon:yes stop_codon:yes gene_type:complete
MADTVEMQDIRGLDVDKLAKGFADEEYIFKAGCQTSTMSGDSIRWYQKTAGGLSATSPSSVELSPLSTPTTLEVSWTRNTSFPKKYMAEGFISAEDIKSADLDVLATSIRDITRAVVSQVDAAIWDVMSESQSPSNIQTFATTAVGGDQWDAPSYAADIIQDFENAKRLIRVQGYDTSNLVGYFSPKDMQSIVTWLISGKGSSIPGFSSEKVKTGVVMELLGITMKVSTNVTADYALIHVPQRSTTFKQYTSTTAATIVEAGIGTKIRVFEAGIAYNTDPKCIVLISDTQT